MFFHECTILALNRAVPKTCYLGVVLITSFYSSWNKSYGRNFGLCILILFIQVMPFISWVTELVEIEQTYISYNEIYYFAHPQIVKMFMDVYIWV